MKNSTDILASSILSSMTLKDVVSSAATITTIGMNCTGVPICQKIRKKGSTGDISSFPFIAGASCTAVWLLYGRLIEDSTIGFVNAIGFLLQSIYVLIYFSYCHHKNSLYKQLIGALVLLSCILFYAFHLGDDEKRITHAIGLCACAGSIIFCASPLSQLASVIRTKSTESLPFLLLFVTFLCTGLWTIYGFLIDDVFVKMPNMLGMMIAAVQLSLFLIYPVKRT